MEDSVLIIGGGIAGIQTALDLADKGVQVHMVEQTPSIGGRMAQLDKTFPTNDCSICILAPKMAECFSHPNVNVMTYSEVKEVSGNAGEFKVRVLRRSRFVDDTKCTGCGNCMAKCPVKIKNDFDAKLGYRSAIYLPFLQAVPRVVTVDKEFCIHFKTGKCLLCVKACEQKAIDHTMEDSEIELDVSAIVVATGFDMWDPSIATEYGYGKIQDVFTSMEYERMINAAGPTGGHICRRSDGEHPKKMAFIQCIGSRDMQVDHPYCCAVGCMFAVKEAMLAREHYDEIESTIFYKDLRTCSKNFFEYVERAKNEYGVRTINSHATVRVNPENQNPIVAYDVRGKLVEEEFEMVILANALIPRIDTPDLSARLGISTDEWGFFDTKDRIMNHGDTDVPGIFIAGYCAGPVDIPESVAQGSAAASKVMEIISEKGGVN